MGVFKKMRTNLLLFFDISKFFCTFARFFNKRTLTFCHLHSGCHSRSATSVQ